MPDKKKEAMYIHSQETEVLEPPVDPEKLTGEYLKRLNDLFETAEPTAVLSWGYEVFGEEMVLGTGFGPSGVFLIHLLSQRSIDIPIFYLDTRLLFDSTYQLKDEIEERYQIRITRVDPGLSLEEQAEKYGEELWNSNPNRCCYLRKVKPLRNYLSDKKAWITGVRRSQSESRKQTKIIEWDPENEVVKINPLARWTGEQVWKQIHDHELNYNPLHDEGYPSIGCIPCTHTVDAAKESDDREGRWKGHGKTECGIHFSTQEQKSKQNKED